MDSDTLQTLVQACPFHRFLRLQLVDFSAEEGRVVLSLTASEDHSRSDCRIELHGGVIASLIDIAGDYAVAVRLGHGVPTIGLHLDYLRPARGISAIASARIRRCGRTIAVVDIDVHDETGALIAVGRGTYSAVTRD